MAHPRGGCFRFCAPFWRQKALTLHNDGADSKLARRLGSVELTTLGVAATFGVGVYLTANETAKSSAGPASLVAFIAAAVIAALPALALAELATRMPICGSSYLYTFVIIGEFFAFLVGWNIILAYAIGAANIARAWSIRFVALVNVTEIENMEATVEIRPEGFKEGFDVVALVFTIFVTVALTIRSRHSLIFNCTFTALNVLLVSALIMVTAGASKLQSEFWNLTSTSNVPALGAGGFMPWGICGIVRATESCFTVFLGCDVIAMTAEEVRNPRSAVPWSIGASLLICMFFFAAISATLTLASPFYLLDSIHPFATVFMGLPNTLDWGVLRLVAAIGCLVALASSLFVALFTLSRIIFAMARDGLLFRCLAWTSDCSKAPIAASILSGLFVGATAFFADLDKLKHLLDAGVLVAFSFLSLAVIFLHGSYDLVEHSEVTPTELEQNIQSRAGSVEELITPSRPLYTCCKMLTVRSFFYHLFVRHSKRPSPISQKVTKVCASLLVAVLFALAAVTSFLPKDRTAFVACAIALGAVALIFLIILQIQPSDSSMKSFRAPLVPWLPAVSLFLQAFMMMQLGRQTWIRYGVWIGFGLLIYIFYGMWNSQARNDVDTHKARKASRWVMENRASGTGGGEISRVTEQTDNALEESMTQF